MIASLIAGFARVFTGVQARWVGCAPSSGQRVYFANHTSNLDFIALWAVLPREIRIRTRPVAALDYWMGGRIRRFFATRVFQSILVERNPAPDRPTRIVDDLIAALRDGTSIIIFPEGRRTLDHEALQPFKSGLYHIAKALPEIELVPVFIDNANRVLPRGEAVPLPLLVSVTFGAAIVLGDEEGKEAFLNRAHQSVAELSL